MFHPKNIIRAAEQKPCEAELSLIVRASIGGSVQSANIQQVFFLEDDAKAIVEYSNKLMFHNIPNFEPTDVIDVWPRWQNTSRGFKEPSQSIQPLDEPKRGLLGIVVGGCGT